MLSLEDDTMLADFTKEEIDHPSPRKQVSESRTIYQSRRFRRPTRGKGYGLPILCDFGEARIGQRQESGPFVQPHIYRAPEIIFEMTWGSPVDIWNLGALMSPLLLIFLLLHCLADKVRFGICLKEHICSEISSIAEAATIHSNILH